MLFEIGFGVFLLNGSGVLLGGLLVEDAEAFSDGFTSMRIFSFLSAVLLLTVSAYIILAIGLVLVKFIVDAVASDLYLSASSVPKYDVASIAHDASSVAVAAANVAGEFVEAVANAVDGITTGDAAPTVALIVAACVLAMVALVVAACVVTTVAFIVTACVTATIAFTVAAEVEMVAGKIVDVKVAVAVLVSASVGLG